MSVIHELKTWPGFFEEIRIGSKTFEIRENDRDFKIGDELLLREWDNTSETYSGRVLLKRITYLLEQFRGLTDGFCVLGLGESWDNQLNK